MRRRGVYSEVKRAKSVAVGSRLGSMIFGIIGSIGIFIVGVNLIGAFIDVELTIYSTIICGTIMGGIIGAIVQPFDF